LAEEKDKDSSFLGATRSPISSSDSNQDAKTRLIAEAIAGFVKDVLRANEKHGVGVKENNGDSEVDKSAKR
jgi:hypothetical protein